MPVYVVTNRATKNVRLVSSDNKSQAVRHVAADTFAIESATAVMVGKLMTDGVKLEDASEPQAQLPLTEGV